MQNSFKDINVQQINVKLCSSKNIKIYSIWSVYKKTDRINMAFLI